MADPLTTPTMDDANLAKIQTLLKAKDDTQRFVGLALLKSLLDNSPQIRQDEAALQELWASISSKFLDRLLRTGSKPSSDNSKEMLDLAVSILHTFSILLPAESLSKTRFTDRTRGLVAALLYRYAAPSSTRCIRGTKQRQFKRNYRIATPASVFSSEYSKWSRSIAQRRGLELLNRNCHGSSQCSRHHFARMVKLHDRHRQQI